MKKIYNIKNVFLLVFATSLIFGCDDYLSEIPDNRTAIDSAEKISELLVIAYPEASYMDMAETMSDNVGDKNSQLPSELNSTNYLWGVTDVDNLDYPVDYWNACYKAIAQANQALFSIEELEGTEDLNPQKGEALLARAYAHFMLVNFWAKHYDPATASTDLGIPYVLEPETEFLVSYTRNSVQEVYNFIEKDIIEGLPLVTNDYQEPKFHFTPAAAKAFATRFYLYKGDWDKVIQYSSDILSANPASQLRDYIGVYDNLEYSQRIALYGSGDDPANLLTVSANSLRARSFASDNYGLSFEKSNELFFSNNLLGLSWVYDVFGGEGVNNLPKFEEFFQVTNVSAGIGNPYVGIVLFSIDEVLLNRAEAYAMRGDFDMALEDLSSFLSVRSTGYDPTLDVLTEGLIVAAYPEIPGEYTPSYGLTSVQASFVKAVAEFRRREYYHEGLRWFDVRRFDLEVTHTFVNGMPDAVLTKGDVRRQLQIPSFATARGLEKNPR